MRRRRRRSQSWLPQHFCSASSSCAHHRSRPCTGCSTAGLWRRRRIVGSLARSAPWEARCSEPQPRCLNVGAAALASLGRSPPPLVASDVRASDPVEGPGLSDLDPIGELVPPRLEIVRGRLVDGAEATWGGSAVEAAGRQRGAVVVAEPTVVLGDAEVLADFAGVELLTPSAQWPVGVEAVRPGGRARFRTRRLGRGAPSSTRRCRLGRRWSRWIRPCGRVAGVLAFIGVRDSGDEVELPPLVELRTAVLSSLDAPPGVWVTRVGPQDAARSQRNSSATSRS